jgi:hypothetical protein
MPCDSIQTAGIELGKVDPVLMLATLSETYRQHGITARQETLGQARGQWVVSHSSRMTTDQATAIIKQTYSHQVVQSQAKKYGWKIQKTSENQYLVVRK